MKEFSKSKIEVALKKDGQDGTGPMCKNKDEKGTHYTLYWVR